MKKKQNQKRYIKSMQKNKKDCVDGYVDEYV